MQPPKVVPDAHSGDILLVEQVDRLSRLTEADWQKLKAELEACHIRVVALDLPTSWMMAAKPSDEFTGRMFEAINRMLLDMLAAVSRKDYDDRRRRQAQGQAKAKTEGRYKGRPEDTARNEGIARMLAAGQSWARFRPPRGAAARLSPRSPNARRWRRSCRYSTAIAGEGRALRPAFYRSRVSRQPRPRFRRQRLPTPARRRSRPRSL
jgi:DNA invertase Pin-like site-specific DNA recombinase